MHFPARAIIAFGLMIAVCQCAKSQSSTSVATWSVGEIAGSPYNGEGPRRGPITGEPYSATTETEHSQTIADGTHFETKRDPQEKTYRDSQGRTRVEHYMPTSLNTGAPPEISVVIIRDPVLGVEYLLNPPAHTARQLPIDKPLLMANGSGTTATIPEQIGAPRAGSGSPKTPPSNDKLRPNTTVEDLGTQVIDGLTVYGTKMTTTIPAGARGNDRPFETSAERWFSKELNIYILIKNTDPRTGESIIRTTDVNRSEPDLSLFQVPPDYKIEEQQ